MMKRKPREQKAVAITYDPDLPAPFIAAKGKGELARKLLAIAEKHGIAVRKEEQLSEMLFDMDVGTFIPEELYEIIAQLLAYVYKVRKNI